MPTMKIIECPRDAWQGLPKTLPTEIKVSYLRKLIEAGFRHIDAVSFVAPKYVPQMADSELVLDGLRKAGFDVEIIGIVVNEAGLERALKAPGVSTIGYPYSVSAHFRRANANMSKAQSQALVEKLQRTVSTPEAPVRNLVVYISMAFGNNYDEPWGPEIVEEAILWLGRIGVRQVSLADTIGTASAEEVGRLFNAVKGAAAGLELGVHLHSRPKGVAEKILAAYEAGCHRFDSALTGLGGCPFAGDDLVGNIPTEIVINALSSKRVETGIEPAALLRVVEATKEIRENYAQL
jgi:hydroxymethylglutaryl-CoA lyase